MRLQDAAVAGLVATCSGRIVPRQGPAQYDEGSTGVTATDVVYETTQITVQPTRTSTAGYQSQVSAGSSVSSDESIIAYVPGDVTSTTTTVLYASTQFSYAPSPIGPGTAPSGYQPSAPSEPSGYQPSAPSGYQPSAPGTTVTSTHWATVTGSAAYPTSPSQQTVLNSTCSGTTLNVLTASLNWWYTQTLYDAVSTFSVQFNGNDSSTGWSLLPATTTFDVTSALAALSDCTSTPSLLPEPYNVTVTEGSCTPAASPVAAETTIITQTAYDEPPSNTGNGTLPSNAIVTPPPASISVADATQAPWAQGTPFVYFSQYEVVTKSVTVYSNGSSGCAEQTQAYTMDDAFSFEFRGGDVNGSQLVGAGVTGDVNPAFLGVVGEETAVAGSWVAKPTVVLLLQKVFAAQAALAATESFLATPEPTRPPFVTLAPTPPEGPPKITNAPAVEISQTGLLVPTRNGDGNLPTPTDVGPAEQNEGGSGSGDNGGSNAGSNEGDNGGDNGGGSGGDNGGADGGANGGGQEGDQTQAPGAGIGGLIGAITSAAKANEATPSPANAFDVFTQAEANLPGSNPTANAIINGMGGSSQNGGGGGSPGAEDGLPGSQNGGLPITFGGAVITPNARDAYRLGPGATLTPGGVVVVDGTTVSLDSAGTMMVVNGVTKNLASPAEATGGPITFGGAVITPNADDAYRLGPGATLTPGGVAVVDGTTVSLDSAGTAIVINGVTQTIASPADATGFADGAGPDIPLVTLKGAYVTPNAATEYSLGPGATLTPGGVAVVDGTTVSMDSSGSTVVVNGVTRVLDSPAGVTGFAGADGSPITLGGAVITPNAATGYVVAPGTTLTPGGQVVVDGTTYSLDDGATALVVDGTTRSLSSPAEATAGGITGADAAATTLAPILTIDGQTFHAINSGTTYVIDGETLTMGEEETVTLDGTVYELSLAPMATRLFVETQGADGEVTATSTQTLFPEQGLGSGPYATASQSGGPEQQLGNVAASGALPWSGLCFAFGSLFLAVWL